MNTLHIQFLQIRDVIKTHKARKNSRHMRNGNKNGQILHV